MAFSKSVNCHAEAAQLLFAAEASEVHKLQILRFAHAARDKQQVLPAGTLRGQAAWNCSR